MATIGTVAASDMSPKTMLEADEEEKLRALDVEKTTKYLVQTRQRNCLTGRVDAPHLLTTLDIDICDLGPLSSLVIPFPVRQSAAGGASSLRL